MEALSFIVLLIVGGFILLVINNRVSRLEHGTGVWEYLYLEKNPY